MTTEKIKKALERPFPVDRIHWRLGSTNAKQLGVKPWEATRGIPLAYIDARDVMKRLDDVLGPENWQCTYPIIAEGIAICNLSVRYPGTDEWITKANGAGDTQVEAEKGKLSDALKRAAVNFGIGRYLYSLPNVWVDVQNGKFDPPLLPRWATPEGYDEIMEKRKET